MIRINTFLLASTLFAFASCSGGEEKTKQETTEAKPAEEKASMTCTYAHADSMPEVLWVAYKYTEKTGVKGQFEKVSVSNTGAGNTISHVLTGAEININTPSSNSGDPTRDPKIKETFFGSLANGEQITGKITGVSGDETGGDLEAQITMNGEEKQAAGTYEVNGDQLELKFELNVGTWSAMDALNALNEVCEDLHKGADGVSILWPDVTVFVTTSLVKNCN